MINENISLNVKPFLLRPAGKAYLWGGCRLKDDFAKDLDVEPLAETWECSTHPDGLSVVASGVFSGRTLADVIKKYPEFLGRKQYERGRSGAELPVLIKLIDAKENLSIQVHPDDDYAFEREHGQRGKTEMWYVVDADKDAELIFGFFHDMKPEVLCESLINDEIEKYVRKVRIQKDDIFFIEAGTVHAIGAGTLIAEIQENSNLTYRLFDYNRVDRNGKKRELHIDKALEVINRKGSFEPRQPLRVLRYRQGCASELLCRCKYFEVFRMLVNTERCRALVDYCTDEMSFHVLLCIGGCGNISMKDGESIDFFKGDCIFFPANAQEVKIHGQAQFLDVRS